MWFPLCFFGFDEKSNDKGKDFFLEKATVLPPTANTFLGGSKCRKFHVALHT